MKQKNSRVTPYQKALISTGHFQLGTDGEVHFIETRKQPNVPSVYELQRKFKKSPQQSASKTPAKTSRKASVKKRTQASAKYHPVLKSNLPNITPSFRKT